MSLILNSDLSESWKYVDHGPGQEYRDAQSLDRYLAIMENNWTSSHFVPNDALLALDMAGFVRGKIGAGPHRPGLSAARLALSLVQPHNQGLVQ